MTLHEQMEEADRHYEKLARDYEEVWLNLYFRKRKITVEAAIASYLTFLNYNGLVEENKSCA